MEKKRILRKKPTNRMIIQADEHCMPQKNTANDAAYDLFIKESVIVVPNTRKYVPLGFKISLPTNMAMIIQPRSGQSGKGMIAKAYPPKWLHFLLDSTPIPLRVNADVLIGLIDPNYGKEVQAIVKTGNLRIKHRIMRLLGFKIYIEQYSRICQGRFVNIPHVELAEGEVTGTRSGLGSSDK